MIRDLIATGLGMLTVFSLVFVNAMVGSALLAYFDRHDGRIAAWMSIAPSRLVAMVNVQLWPLLLLSFLRIRIEPRKADGDE